MDYYLQNYFIMTLGSKYKYDYRIYRKPFLTKTDLFIHLRDVCWKKTSRQAPIKSVTSPSGLVKPASSLSEPDKPLSPVSPADAKTPAWPDKIHVIESDAEPTLGSGYAFRNFHYAVAELSFGVNDAVKHEFCVDSGYTMSVINCSLLPAAC